MSKERNLDSVNQNDARLNIWDIDKSFLRWDKRKNLDVSLFRTKNADKSKDILVDRRRYRND